jgi:glycosyltransferase involved in cell wall biosynthesis
MKILGLAAADYDPASRFRILQYQKFLDKLGTTLDCRFPFPPKESAPSRWVLRNQWVWHQCQVIGRLNLVFRQLFHDIIWQNRLLLSGYYSAERLYQKKKLVFDIDDAIWLTEGKQQVNRIIQNARMVFAGNSYLADYCTKLNKDTLVVPSVIDTDKFKPAQKQDAGTFTIGWIGTESNFSYLNIIKEPVKQFLSQTKNTRLVIVSSKKPDLFRFENEKIIFRKWSEQDEVNFINEFDIGIMPLIEDDWTKGKCGYKILQYMSCRKAFVASPAGVNKHIIEKSEAGIAANTADEWLKAFNYLLNDYAMRNNISEKGRHFVENYYSCNIWAPRINDYFKKIS